MVRAATVLAVALLLAACESPGGVADDVTGTTAAPGEPLLVLGDSLTVGARLWGGLESALGAAGWDPEVVAQDGRSISWGLDQVERRDDVPTTVVVGLGTNSAPSAEAFAADAAELVAELTEKGATSIVWLAPQHRDDDRYRARADALRALAGGPLAVPDWPRVLAAHPEWFDDDGIHLLAEGYEQMVVFIRDQLEV